MPVGELLERTSAHELMEWAKFYELEPFGSEANFLGHAITAATVANSNRSKGQRTKKVQDFMPVFEKRKLKDPKEIYEAIKENLAHFKMGRDARSSTRKNGDEHD